MARGGFSTTFEVEGRLGKPLAALRHLRELGGDLLPFMEDARGILVRSILRRFETGRGPGGIPWQQTKRQVRQAVGSHGPNKARILVDTGDLQDSIRGEVGPNYVEVGSDGLKNPVKAIANQYGSHRQAVVVAHGMITNLPARPFVGIDDQDEEDVEEAWKARLIATFASGAANA